MLGVFLEHRTEIQITMSWLICLVALFRGGGPEKAIAIIWLAVFEITHRLYHLAFNPVFQADQFDVFHASLDLVASIAFVAVALNANRFYPLWIAAFQLVALSAHLARGIADQITPIAYAFLVIAPSWFQLVIFAVGILAHRKRYVRFGRYRDWRWSEPALPESAARGAGLSA